MLPCSPSTSKSLPKSDHSFEVSPLEQIPITEISDDIFTSDNDISDYGGTESSAEFFVDINCSDDCSSLKNDLKTCFQKHNVSQIFINDLLGVLRKHGHFSNDLLQVYVKNINIIGSYLKLTIFFFF